MTKNVPPLAGRAFTIFPNDAPLRQAHVFSVADEDAILCALDARRPLLLRGEPGVGKTQLAQAAAIALQRGFVSHAVDALTDPRDLRWWEDAVERLAQAQAAGLSQKAVNPRPVMRLMARDRFIRPGPLWWGFDWESAKGHAAEPAQPHPDCQPSNGVVVLIDEIDKADAAVPNGLLEALGNRSFTPPAGRPLVPKQWPLVIITSNEQRRLPDAFLRRCVVYDMAVPEGEGFIDWLVARGRLHFPQVSPNILALAARQVQADRQAAAEFRLHPLPGQAEYLDLLHALFARGEQSDEALTERLRVISGYFLRKHGDSRVPSRFVGE